MSPAKVQRILKEITHLSGEERSALLKELPTALALSPDEVERLRLAELAFTFWDNPTDAAYDTL